MERAPQEKDLEAQSKEVAVAPRTKKRKDIDDCNMLTMFDDDMMIGLSGVLPYGCKL